MSDQTECKHHWVQVEYTHHSWCERCGVLRFMDGKESKNRYPRVPIVPTAPPVRYDDQDQEVWYACDSAHSDIYGPMTLERALGKLTELNQQGRSVDGMAITKFVFGVESKGLALKYGVDPVPVGL